MRVEIGKRRVVVRLSACDTREWCDARARHGSGERQLAYARLSGRWVRATYDADGIRELRMAGGTLPSCGTEWEVFEEMVSDYAGKRVPREHVCWQVVTGHVWDRWLARFAAAGGPGKGVGDA